MALTNGQLLKYGPIKNEVSGPYIPIPMGASEVVAAKSGRFVKNDGSGRAEIAVAGSTLLLGWIELPHNANYSSTNIFTCSATEGGDVAPLIPAWAALGIVFRIPVNTGTFVATMRGKTCDLSVVSNIQGAALGASTEDTIIIVDGDLVNNAWVDVMINPSKITGLTGVV